MKYTGNLIKKLRTATFNGKGWTQSMVFTINRNGVALSTYIEFSEI